MKASLSFLLLAVFLLSLAIMGWVSGWFFVIVGVWLFPIILLVHCFVHVQAISKRPRVPEILVSHTLLMAAWLFRVDAGDASSYIVIDVIARRLGIDFRAPDWMGGPTGQVLDLFLFVLVAVSWLFVFPFSDPKLGGRILVAILVPWWHFYTVGRRLAALLCFVLVLTATGWIPASIWALFSLFRSGMDEAAEPSRIDS